MHRLPSAAMLALALAFAPLCGRADTLSEIYALALANDAQYAAAVRTAAAGREKSAQGRALLRPTVGLSAYLRGVHDSPGSLSGSASYSSANVTLSASQPVMRQVNWAIYRQGELQAQLADQQLRLAEQDLILRVARGYFEVLQAQDVLTTLGSQKEAFATELAQARRRNEVGLAPVTDVNEAQTRYDLTVAQEIAARNDLEVKRRTLQKAINRPLPVLAPLDPVANINILTPMQMQAFGDSAADAAAQVLIGRLAEQIARFEVDRQAAGHVPTLDLVGNLTRNSSNTYGTIPNPQTHTSYIGVEFSVPLYQGGAINSREREATANLGRAQMELEDTRRQATFNANQALLGVQSGIALNSALTQAIASAETQVRSTRRGLEVGVRTRVDVLNAEQQLYTTQRDLSAARYQTLISGLQLKASAGAISEQDLRMLDALLKP